MRKSKNRKQYKVSIKLRDSFILVIVIVLFIILTLRVEVGTRGYEARQINLLYNSMDILGKNQKVHFQQFIDNKIVILQGLTQYPEIYEMSVEKQTRFLKGNAEKFGFRHFFVLDNEGNEFYFDENRFVKRSDVPLYDDIMKHDVFIAEPYAVEDGIIITVCVSINHNGGKQGLLCGVVRLDEIIDMLVENEIPLQGKLFLVNRKGQYLAADVADKVNNRMSIYDEQNSDVTLIKEAFLEQSDKLGNIILHGKEFIAHIIYLPNYDWLIVQCVDNSEIYRELKFFDIWKVGTIACIALLIFCVMKIIVYWHRSIIEINTDALTKCNSRIAMQKMIEELENDYSKRITIIYFDLNKFKQVNDTYGHDEGDRILCVFGTVLRSTFDKIAQIGRMGGDEFLAIAVDVKEEKIVELVNQVNERLQEKKKELKLPYEISTSYGYASREKGSELLMSDIIKLADENMYQYKEAVHKRKK